MVKQYTLPQIQLFAKEAGNVTLIIAR